MQIIPAGAVKLRCNKLLNKVFRIKLASIVPGRVNFLPHFLGLKCDFRLSFALISLKFNDMPTAAFFSTNY